MNRNCLSYWFPKLQAAGLPVPKTEILMMPDEHAKIIWSLFDGKCTPEQAESLKPFEASVADACDRMGYPCFLRTGHFSGKHNWKNTCFVPDRACVGHRIYNLCEMSEMVGMFGELPWRIWCVREFLPTRPIATLQRYGDMPLVREVRAFVRGGEILCVHPYWPAGAIEEGFREPPENLASIIAMANCVDRLDDAAELNQILSLAAHVFSDDGAWSVDVLWTELGLYVTDMAEADRSFHWPDCRNSTLKPPHTESTAARDQPQEPVI